MKENKVLSKPILSFEFFFFRQLTAECPHEIRHDRHQIGTHESFDVHLVKPHE